MKPYQILLIYYAVLSLIAFLRYAADKRKAKKGKWRTPEAVLLSLGFFGGGVGAVLGMLTFHHKTRHWYFWAVNLLGVLWQAGLLYLLLK